MCFYAIFRSSNLKSVCAAHRFYNKLTTVQNFNVSATAKTTKIHCAYRYENIQLFLRVHVNLCNHEIYVNLFTNKNVAVTNILQVLKVALRALEPASEAWIPVSD